MSSKDKKTLATLIYYPKEKMELIKKKEENMRTGIRLYRLIEICKRTSSKYSNQSQKSSASGICLCH